MWKRTVTAALVVGLGTWSTVGCEASGSDPDATSTDSDGGADGAMDAGPDDGGPGDAGADAGTHDATDATTDPGGGDATTDPGGGDATTDPGGGDATGDPGGGDGTTDGGSDTDAAGDGMAGGDADGGGGDTVAAVRHECDTDADCAPGTCRPLTDHALASRVCVAPPPRATRDCAEVDPSGGIPNECCADDECTDEGGVQGYCQDFTRVYCGGAPPPEVNTCRYDGCQADADCAADRACLDAGLRFLVTNVCNPAACFADVDCAARAGGQCRLLTTDSTCYAGAILGCTYADSGCRADADCGPGFFCVANETRDDATCQEEMPVP